MTHPRVSATPCVSAPRRALAADLALLGVTFVWGLTFPLIKPVLASVPPLEFSAVRLSVAAAVMMAFFRPAWRQLPASIWGASALLGLFLGSGYALQTAGLVYVAPAVSAFLTSISVILVPVLLAVFWARRLHLRDWAAATLALGGLALLLLAPQLSSHTHNSAWIGWTLSGLCAVAFALHISSLGQWAPQYRLGDLATLQISFAAAANWLALAAFPAAGWHNSIGLWAILAFTAVVATALAFTVQTWAQQHTPATHVAVIFAFEPVFAALASWWGWGQRLQPLQWVGATLIVVAMLLVGG